MKHTYFVNRAGPSAWCLAGVCLGLCIPLAKATDPPLVAEVEYYFDTGPNLGNGKLVPVYGDGANFTADLSNLRPGTHTMYMRVRPPGGAWGPQMPMTVTVDPSSANQQVAALEMSIDTPAAPGMGTLLQGSAGMGNPATVESVINLEGQRLGTRVLYFRAKDSAGTWGPAFPSLVVLEDSHPTEQPRTFEYSWDRDPATRVWTPMTLAHSSGPVAHHEFDLDLTGMQLGTKTLAMRAIDSSGSPGLPFLMPVAVVPDSLMGHPSPAAKLVTYAASGGLMIPQSYTETLLGANPSEEQLLMLSLAAATPGDAEVVSYLVSQSGEAGPQRTTGFRVVVDGTNGYAEWTRSDGYFTPDELLDPLVSGSGADPDGDGVPNEIECALRTHPRQPSAGAIPSMKLDGTRLLFTFRQVHGGVGHRASNYTVDGMRYTVEWSHGLSGDWQSAVPGSFEVSRVTNNGDGTDTVEVAASEPITAGHAKVFLRLRVVLF